MSDTKLDETTSCETNSDTGEIPERTLLTRRTCLKLSGLTLVIGAPGAGSTVARANSDGYGDGGYGEGPYGDPSSVSVTTGSAHVDETSSTLTGTLSELGDATSTDVYFEWGPAGEKLSNTTRVQTLTSTGEFSVAIRNLNPGDDYEYRAVAETDDESDTGSTVGFTTDSYVDVTTTSPTNVDDTSATLHGTLGDLGGDDSVEAYFEWGESSKSISNTTSVQTLSSTGGFEAEITGLSPGTKYTYRAVTNASDGDTDVGTDMSFTTG